jgi:hypothetical protein
MKATGSKSGLFSTYRFQLLLEGLSHSCRFPKTCTLHESDLGAGKAVQAHRRSSRPLRP